MTKSVETNGDMGSIGLNHGGFSHPSWWPHIPKTHGIHGIHGYHIWHFLISLLVGGFSPPLWTKKKSVDSQYMENKCSKPPTRLDIIFQPFHQTGVRDGKLAPRAPATSRSTRVSTLDALDGIEATCFVEDNTERMTICIVLMGFPCYSRYNL
jgi:hypothetical protein